MNLCRTFSHRSLNSNQENTAPGRKPQPPPANKERHKIWAWEFKCHRYLFTEHSLLFLRDTSPQVYLPVSPPSHQTHLTLSQETLEQNTVGRFKTDLHPACPSQLPNILLFHVLEPACWTLGLGVLSSKGSSNSWGNWNRVKNKLWQWPWQLFSPQPARAPHANVTSLSTILKIRMWEAEINALPASATQRLPAVSRSALQTQSRTANAPAWSLDLVW